jgi:hypothetical protein
MPNITADPNPAKTREAQAQRGAADRALAPNRTTWALAGAIAFAGVISALALIFR